MERDSFKLKSCAYWTRSKDKMTKQEPVTEEEQLTSLVRARRTGTARIGVFNVGFHRYWPQFPGLRERLAGYREEFEERLRRMGAEIVSAGLVDDVASGRRAGDFFAAQHVDIIFCFVTTYVQSA